MSLSRKKIERFFLIAKYYVKNFLSLLIVS